MNAFPNVVLELVRSGNDMTMRQAAVLLTVATAKHPPTVGEVAADLNVRTPVVTRALDTLERFAMAGRRRDPADRRRVLVEATRDGHLMASRMTGDMERRTGL